MVCVLFWIVGRGLEWGKGVGEELSLCEFTLIKFSSVNSKKNKMEEKKMFVKVKKNKIITVIRAIKARRAERRFWQGKGPCWKRV